MAKQADLDRAYMEMAIAISKLSVARRKQVGAILVSKDGGVIAEGYNGTPAGFDNNCEEPNPLLYSKIGSGCMLLSQVEIISPLVTKKEVLHAESNAITKVAKSTNSSSESTLYVTLSPCFDCAKLIIQAGIKRVVYMEQYKSDDGEDKTAGIELLQKAQVKVEQLCGI